MSFGSNFDLTWLLIAAVLVALGLGFALAAWLL